jgi:hypothetical protein
MTGSSRLAAGCQRHPRWAESFALSHQLDDEAALSTPAGDEGRLLAAPPATSATFSVSLTAEEVAALRRIAAQDELSEQQALLHLTRSRLLGRPQFSRPDRARRRSSLALLRALDRHLGRAARPLGARDAPPDIAAARVDEIQALGVHVRRVCDAIGQSLLGNLRYWQGEDETP